MKRQIYKKCNNCKNLRQTRRFNVRHQDFYKRYKRVWDSDELREHAWIYHTMNYSFCKECMKKIIKILINKIK